MTESTGVNPKARGGYARAKSLSASERSESARRAAMARWGADAPRATHEGPLRIGNQELMSAVLSDGTRVLSQATFLRALGRSRSPKAGTGVLSTAEAGLPFFLQAALLEPYISNELRQAAKPIAYFTKSGRPMIGYDAELLPMVCEVYLRLRDDQPEVAARRYERIIQASDMLMRGLARIGIIALIDEATGYQEVRDRLALQAILDKFLAKELAAWAKRFPDEFYKQMFRLRGWDWMDMSSTRRPRVVGRLTKDIVYERLAPGILEELQRRNPLNEKGRRSHRHHQWLTEDIGHPALAQHLHAVIALMRASNSWGQFMTMLNLALPKKNATLMMPFVAEVELRQGL